MNRSGYAAHHSSIIQSFHARTIASARSLSSACEELRAAEARERREQQLGPHAVLVHRPHALVHVERGRDHVLVAPGVEVVAATLLAGPEPARVRVALEGQRVEAVLPEPALGAVPLDDARRPVPELRVDVIDEDVRRLDDVVVDGDQLDVSHGASRLLSRSRRSELQRQVLDAAVDDRAQALDRPRHLERLQAREQVAEDRLELDARDVRAHAEVLAEPEREVRVRAPVDAERERVVEHLLVAVRRREVQRELLAGRDRRRRGPRSPRSRCG